MADNRLKKLKIDKEGKWVKKYESIIDDIILYYQSLPINEIFIDITLTEKQQDKIEHILLLNFANEVFEIVKFYPFLLNMELYEIMSKAELVIDHLGAEKLKQATYLKLNNVTIDEFAEMLVLQKKEIVEQVTGANKYIVTDYLNEEDL